MTIPGVGLGASEVVDDLRVGMYLRPRLVASLSRAERARRGGATVLLSAFRETSAFQKPPASRDGA